MTEIGPLRVHSAGFACLKGTRHRPVPGVLVDRGGAVGDRGLCLVDVARRQVLRTVENPTLVAIRADLADGALAVETPEGDRAQARPEPTGETVTCDYWGRPVDVQLLSGPHAELLSSWLGRPVRLAAAPRRGVVYGGAVSIVALPSLRALAESSGDPSLLDEAARFRATVVVEHDGAAYDEHDWVGQQVRIGAATLRISEPIPRCAVIDLDPVTGERRGRLLRTLAATRPSNTRREPFFGVSAEVLEPGVLNPPGLALSGVGR